MMDYKEVKQWVASGGEISETMYKIIINEVDRLERHDLYLTNRVEMLESKLKEETEWYNNVFKEK